MDGKTGITNLSVEELKKYKALLDEGAITEEEFQKIKAELLENDGKANTPPTKAPAAKFDLKKNLKFIIPAVAVFAAIIVAIVSIVISVGSNNPESVAKAYTKASYTDREKKESLCAYDWEKYISNRWGTSEKFFSSASDDYNCPITTWREYYKAYDAYWKERYEDKYGKFKVTAEVSDVADISIQGLYDDSPSIAFNLMEYVDFDFDQVDEAKVYTVLTNIKGENGSFTSKEDVYVVKCNGKWGVYSASYYAY